MRSEICHVNLARGFRGGERQTELLIRALSERHIPQRLVVRRGQPLARRLSGLKGLTMREIGKPFHWHVRQTKGCFVHAHDGHGAKFAFVASVFSKSPYIVTRRIAKRPGDHAWTRAAFGRAAVVVAVSRFVAEIMQDYLPVLAPRVVHDALSGLAVDRQQRDAIRSRWAGRFLVVNTAALINSVKGQSYLIAAAHKLAVARPDMMFVLLGEGSDRARFEAEAAGLSNVVFEGFVDNVGDYLSAADAFVFPSRHEGLGSSCLDAMAFGLPVVASAVGGVPEIVKHESNGLLVPPAAPDALVEALCRIHDDAALARRLGEQGREAARAHLPECMADQYLEIYTAAGWSQSQE